MFLEGEVFFMYDKNNVSAYKYGIIRCPHVCDYNIGNLLNELCNSDDDSCINSSLPKYAEISTRFDPEYIIEFQDVSGLSLGDLSNFYNLIYNNKYLLFVMFDSLLVSRKSPFLPSPVWENEVYLRYITAIDVTKNKDTMIDKIICDRLGCNYKFLNPSNTRRAACFRKKSSDVLCWVDKAVIDCNNMYLRK